MCEKRSPGGSRGHSAPSDRKIFALNWEKEGKNHEIEGKSGKGRKIGKVKIEKVLLL